MKISWWTVRRFVFHCADGIQDYFGTRRAKGDEGHGGYLLRDLELLNEHFDGWHKVLITKDTDAVEDYNKEHYDDNQP